MQCQEECDRHEQSSWRRKLADGTPKAPDSEAASAEYVPLDPEYLPMELGPKLEPSPQREVNAQEEDEVRRAGEYGPHVPRQSMLWGLPQ